MPSIASSDTTHKKYELDYPPPCLYRSANQGEDCDLNAQALVGVGSLSHRCPCPRLLFPAPSCSTSLLGTRCSYAVKTNCTTATTPPDYNVGIVNSGDYVGIATYVSWISAAACIRFNIAGPWICTPGLSFINSMNVVMPPYACTYNP